jgi:hypothetical protein
MHEAVSIAGDGNRGIRVAICVGEWVFAGGERFTADQF